MEVRVKYNIISFGTYHVTLEYGPSHVLKAIPIRKIKIKETERRLLVTRPTYRNFLGFYLTTLKESNPTDPPP